MQNLLRLLLSEPLATLVIGVGILVIGALLFSDWAEKRRERQLLELRARARNIPGASPLNAPVAAGLASSQPQQKSLFRTFGWELSVIAIAVAALVIFSARNKKAPAELAVEQTTTTATTATTAATQAAITAPSENLLPSESLPAGGFDKVSLSLSSVIPADPRSSEDDDYAEFYEDWSADASLELVQLRYHPVVSLWDSPSSLPATPQVPRTDEETDEFGFLRTMGSRAASYYPIDARSAMNGSPDTLGINSSR